MKVILGITNELSKALQRKDQDIVNAMTLVKISKQRSQMSRDEGCDSFYEQVCPFCEIENINVPKMGDMFIARLKIEALDDQLETYILDRHSNKEFVGLKGIGALAEKIVATKKHELNEHSQ
ncbi:hypothetical protein PTKIN_Ptkin11bG0100900 [Pterospermum kingtungense]